MAALFEHYKVKDFVEESPNFDLIWVSEDDTVANVLQLFKTHDITSAPVKNKVQQCVGIIDMVGCAWHYQTIS
jgi:predicted transcriptional regulator